jgi:hypothetical protein
LQGICYRCISRKFTNNSAPGSRDEGPIEDGVTSTGRVTILPATPDIVASDYVPLNGVMEWSVWLEKAEEDESEEPESNGAGGDGADEPNEGEGLLLGNDDGVLGDHDGDSGGGGDSEYEGASVGEGDSGDGESD